MYRNHCNTLAVTHYTGGRNNAIAELLRDGKHALETWGNSREGFVVYIVDIPGRIGGIQISSGSYTLRRDAIAACKRAYGDGVKVSRGRNW